MNWLEIVVVVILLAAAITGYIRGFIKSVFAIVSLVVIIGLSWVATPYVSSWIGEHTNLETTIDEHCTEAVRNKVEEQLTGAVKADESTGSVADGAQAMDIDPTIVEKLTEAQILDRVKADYPSIIGDKIQEGLLDQAENTGTIERVGSSLGGVIYKGVIFVITMLLITILLKIIEAVLNLVSKLPVLNSLNKWGGLLVGLVRGLIWIWILGVVLSIGVATTWGQSAIVMVQDSVFLSALYSHNAIQALISIII